MSGKRYTDEFKTEADKLVLVQGRSVPDMFDHTWSDYADPELRETFTDLLASADDAGWAVPDERIQQ